MNQKRRIYVASSWRNPEQPELVEVLRSAGHEVYDFRHPNLGRGNDDGFRWSEIDEAWEQWTPAAYREALYHPVAEEGFGADFDAMQWADTCVLLTPSGRSAHLEAGWMSGAGKHVLVLLRPGEPELMYRLLGALCLTPAELLEEIEQLP